MNVGKLIVCPTPLGNLGDVSQRVLDALRSADTICAEDTRVTGRLLAAYHIQQPLERLDEEALSRCLPRIIERLCAGEVIAYCSDAGMPGVSDPGLRLVRAAQDAQVRVEVLPGPSAVVTAYVASGFTAPSFYFGGFFPRKDTERRSLLESLKNLDAVLVFYESPQRVVAALGVIAEVFPGRQVALCRELTKLHEEVVRADAPELYQQFRKRREGATIKGEIVLCIDAPPVAEKHLDAQRALEAARARACELQAEGGRSSKDIIAQIQAEFGIPRNAAYEMVVTR